VLKVLVTIIRTYLGLENKGPDVVSFIPIPVELQNKLARKKFIHKKNSLKKKNNKNRVRHKQVRIVHKKTWCLCHEIYLKI
jgi:hypothetical protein